MATPPYRLERDHHHTIVTLLPGLNDAPWSDIEQIGNEIIHRLQEVPAPALLVDLCPLDYMGSVQVALVVRTYKTVKERGGKMVVAAHEPLVREVLSLAGLDKLWTTVPSREAGLQWLAREAGTASSGGWMSLLGAACVLVSLVGLFAVMSDATWLARSSAVWLEFSAAAVGFVFGLWTVIKATGMPRTIGLGSLVGSVALLLNSVFALGSMRAVPDLPNANAPMVGDSEPARDVSVNAEAEPESPPILAAEPSAAEVPTPTDPDALPADAANPDRP
jgi:anti-anti-sigma factor